MPANPNLLRHFFGQNISGGHRLFGYYDPTKTLAEVSAPDYFMPVKSAMSAKDWMVIGGSDGGALVRIVSLTHDGIEVDAVAGSGGATAAFLEDPYFEDQPVVGVMLVGGNFATDQPEDAEIEYQWFNGEPGNGGTPIPGATDFTYTPTDDDFGAAVDGNLLWRRERIVLGAAVLAQHETNAGLIAKPFIEDFSDFADGDGRAEAAAFYTLSSAKMDMAFATDNFIADPAVKMEFFNNAADDAGVFATKPETQSYFFEHGNLTMEELFLFQAPASPGRYSFRTYTAVGGYFEPGINVWDNRVGLFTNEGVSVFVADGAANHLGDVVNGEWYWVRVYLDPTTVRARFWHIDEVEPPDWQASAAGTNLRAVGFGFSPRVGILTGNRVAVRWWGVTYNGSVAMPDITGTGVIPDPDPPPPPGDITDDAFGYVAPATSDTAYYYNQEHALTLSAPAPIGKYEDGTKFIVMPSGGTVTAITPDFSVALEYNPHIAAEEMVTRNGIAVHPPYGETTSDPLNGPTTQPYVDLTDVNNGGPLLPYSAGPTLPLVIPAGAHRTIMKSETEQGISGQSRNIVWRHSYFTVVPTAPPANSFRPGIMQTDKTITFTTGDLIDMATLPKNAVISGSPSFDTLFNRLRYPVNMIYTRDGHKERTMGHYPGGRNSGVTWGAEPGYGLASVSADACLFLCSDHPDADKLLIAKAAVQRGLDMISLLDVGREFGGVNIGSQGRGGHYPGMKMYAMLAALLLDDATLLSKASVTDPWSEDHYWKTVTQNDINNASRLEDRDLDAPTWYNKWPASINEGSRRLGTWQYDFSNINWGMTTMIGVLMFPGMYSAWNVPGTNDAFFNALDRANEAWWWRNPAEVGDPTENLPYSSGPQPGPSGNVQDLMGWVLTNMPNAARRPLPYQRTTWTTYRSTLTGVRPIWSWPAWP